MSVQARQAVFKSVGAPIEVVVRPLGEVPPRTLRVRMQAAGVANADLMILEGTYPYMPEPGSPIGYDLVGVVEAVGAEVEGIVPGQRVGALMLDHGAYGDLVDVPAEAAVAIPEDVDAAQAVALFLNYLTAEQMLHRIADVQRGQKILVNSAAGGVGTALLELAAQHGLRATGSASAAKLPMVAATGAVPFDYQTRDYDTLDRDYDVVFDAVGGPAIGAMYRRLRRGGTYVSYGFLYARGKGKMAMLPTFLSLGLRMLWPDGRRVRFNMGLPQLVKKEPSWYRETMARLLRQLASEALSPSIAARVPLDTATSAHDLLAGGTAVGKIVLVP